VQAGAQTAVVANLAFWQCLLGYNQKDKDMNILQGINGKLLVIAILVLIMLIPMGMVESLVDERQSYKQQAIGDVTSKWGQAQVLTGPLLSVPFRTYVHTDQDKRVEVLHHRHFLPDNLNMKGTLTSSVRQRGIYEVVLYNLTLEIHGQLAADIAAQMDVLDEDIVWEQATLSLGITDMAGIQKRIPLQLGDWQTEMGPGLADTDVIASGVSVRVPDLKNRSGQNFRIQLDLNGSDSLSFVPVARDNRVELTSDWPHPGFSGAFLPQQHTSDDIGFQADWSVLNLNRNYPQTWIDEQYRVAGSAFGVDLYMAADVYQQSVRSIKYALLFILAAFGSFFSFELVRGNRVHPFQYSLIGIAVAVFYLLLISLSEHLGFDMAYLLAATAVTIMMGLYAGSVLNGQRPGWIISAVMALLYGYLYALLQLQDYALLVGSIGLFIGLAVLMYISRKVDWYGLKESGQSGNKQ
jgi:inner membrane protein